MTMYSLLVYWYCSQCTFRIHLGINHGLIRLSYLQLSIPGRVIWHWSMWLLVTWWCHTRSRASTVLAHLLSCFMMTWWNVITFAILGFIVVIWGVNDWTVEHFQMPVHCAILSTIVHALYRNHHRDSHTNHVIKTYAGCYVSTCW